MANDSTTDFFEQKILSLDTTLRDGDQAPGIHLSAEKKLWLAKKLDENGANIIEAGFAAVSEGERQALREIAKAGLNAQVISFARTLKSDIDDAAQCGVQGVHLVFPSSELHCKEKLHKTPNEAIPEIIDCVKHAKSLGLAVELSAEDGSRADPEFLKKIFLEGAKAGADRFCICDTVGILSPEKSFELFRSVKLSLGNKILAVHCHNDLGLATANTLAALRAGAGEFHATINGIGERTGNAALEEVAFGLSHFYGKKTVNLEKLYELSGLAKNLSNFPLAPNKPLVGENAFSHESGMHVDGIIKNVKTYEGFAPELLGRKRKIVLGKMSGRKAIDLKLKEFGIEANEAMLEEIFGQVKSLGDRGKLVTDADLLAIYQQVAGNGSAKKIILEELSATTGNAIRPFAQVRIKMNENGQEQIKTATGTGDGPVDAALNAIYSAIGKGDIVLEEYKVEAITGGWDALVSVKVKMRRGDKEIYSGAVGTDIVMTSADAAIKAINVLV